MLDRFFLVHGMFGPHFMVYLYQRACTAVQSHKLVLEVPFSYPSNWYVLVSQLSIQYTGTVKTVS